MPWSPSQALLASTYYKQDHICLHGLWFKHEQAQSHSEQTWRPHASVWTCQIYCQNTFHHWRSFMTHFVGLIPSTEADWSQASSRLRWIVATTLEELKSLKSQAQEARNCNFKFVAFCSDLSRFLCTVGTVGADVAAAASASSNIQLPSYFRRPNFVVASYIVFMVYWWRSFFN